MIQCVGIGPGNLEYLTAKAEQRIRTADLVAGFTTVVEFVQEIISPQAQTITMNYKDQVAQLERVAQEHHNGKQCVVVFMGDIHFSGFQYLERIEKACGHPVETIPGISSSQILASKAKVCFDETTFLTFHRRGDLQPFKQHLISVLQDQRNAIVIPHPWGFMPKDISAYLLENGIDPELPVEVWENLTGEEATWKGILAECTLAFSDMSIMLIRALHPMPSQI